MDEQQRQAKLDAARKAVHQILDGCRALRLDAAGQPEEIFRGSALSDETLVYHLSSVVHGAARTLDFLFHAAASRAGLAYDLMHGAYSPLPARPPVVDFDGRAADDATRTAYDTVYHDAGTAELDNEVA